MSVPVESRGRCELPWDVVGGHLDMAAWAASMLSKGMEIWGVGDISDL